MNNVRDPVLRLIDACNRIDMDAIIDCFTDDAVYHNIPMAALQGKAAMLVWVATTGTPLEIASASKPVCSAQCPPNSSTTSTPPVSSRSMEPSRGDEVSRPSTTSASEPEADRAQLLGNRGDGRRMGQDAARSHPAR